MITLVFSPQWFYGYDIIFESLAVLVTLIIGFYTLNLYRFSKDRTHKFFGLSFLAFGTGFLAKIATNFAIYYQNTVKTSLAPVIERYELLERSNLILQAGYDVHRFLILLGLLGIYWAVSKSADDEHRWMFVYLLFIVALFSFGTYYVFHLTAIMLLWFIAQSLHRNYEGKSGKALRSARLNFLAFATLLISQVVFTFVWLNSAIYVVAESVQLLGFCIFLANLILLVLPHDQKKD